MASRTSSIPRSMPLQLRDSSRKHLRTFLAQSPRGLFSDIDGTLSAIAPTPESATLLPGVKESLEEICTLFETVAVISGRAAPDAYRMVGVSGLLYIGNHGLDRLIPDVTGGEAGFQHVIMPAAEAYIQRIDIALDEVERALTPSYPGILVEHKGVTGSIHVRNTADPVVAGNAVTAALTTIAREQGLVVTLGKLVVELRPPIKVNKGTIIADLVREHRLKGALYMGDDYSDIDAFRALRELTRSGACQGVSVAILHSEAPPHMIEEADVALDPVERVPSLLRWLARHAHEQSASI